MGIREACGVGGQWCRHVTTNGCCSTRVGGGSSPHEHTGRCPLVHSCQSECLLPPSPGSCSSLRPAEATARGASADAAAGGAGAALPAADTMLDFRVDTPACPTCTTHLQEAKRVLSVSGPLWNGGVSIGSWGLGRGE